MSRDLESQLAAFARALDSRSDAVEPWVARPTTSRPKGESALLLAVLAVVALIAVPILLLDRDPLVAPPFSSPSSTSPSTNPGSTAPPEEVAIPADGIAILGDSGIKSADGSMIWSGQGQDRGRLFGDGYGGLVYTDSEGLWWLGRPTPELAGPLEGDLIEVIPSTWGPVARIGSCPSTYFHFNDGSGSAVDGRVDIDCATGDIVWRAEDSSLIAVLNEPDPDGIVWLDVIEFDRPVAMLPVGGPYIRGVRIEDFHRDRVLLSRSQGGLEYPPDEFLVVDLHQATVEVVSANRDDDRSATLLGRDDAALPRAWVPSWIGEPPHRPDLTDFFDRLPLSLRSEPLWKFESEEGTWVLSRPSDGLLNLSRAWGCGVPDTDWCTYEYGEILLVSEGGLEFAVPTPGLPSTWLAVRDDYVYAGRIGDGALPDSSLIRIDRATHEVVPIVFRVDVDRGHIWPQGGPIFVNPADPMWERFEAAVSLAPARSEPVDGTTPVRVDFEAVDELIEDLIAERAVVD